MYKPAFFQEDDQDEVRRIMREHPLASVVANTQNGLIASQLPLLEESDGILFGHIAKNNDMHRDIADGTEVLVIFTGQDSYISPNWYPTKPQHHRFVPTWNYQTIHVYGNIRFDHSEKFKRKVVGKLTAHFERETNGESAWRMADAPTDYMTQMLDNIVAFDIAITRIEAASKVSQNREEPDHENVRKKMKENGKEELAARMWARKN